MNMNISALSEKIEATILTMQADTQRVVSSGYTCDLLSWVMAHGREGMAWITVQTHMNVIAVATLHDMACVIIPEGIKVENDVIEKADEEGICVLASPLTAYEISGRMHDSGIGAM
ncbi:MAG: AraC family transcriptional regulator [Clostridiales bacterium]|nr:AraC family transcriptional regulator [Clostridiales bacterium]